MGRKIRGREEGECGRKFDAGADLNHSYILLLSLSSYFGNTRGRVLEKKCVMSDGRILI